MRDNQKPELSRRTLFGALAGGAALAMPGIAATAAAAAVAETAELLDLEVKLDLLVNAYRAAADRLRVAREVAEGLWPEVPAEILTTLDDRRSYPSRCYARETDMDGSEVWPPTYVGEDGKTYGLPPRQLFRAKPLKGLMVEHEIRPRTKWGRQLKAIIAVAEKYEAACAHAIEVSGIDEAKGTICEAARSLEDLASQVRKIGPRTMSGVLIQASVLVANDEAAEHAHLSYRHVGFAGGRELANALLRLAPRASA